MRDVRLRHAVPTSAGAAGAAVLGYSSGIELRWFRLRRVRVPLLPPDSDPLRILHISDLHLVPRQRRKIAWVRSLAALRPHLVINTGDSIAHPHALPALRRALAPLLRFPGVFVYGSNDYYAPQLKNPLRYLYQPPGGIVPRTRELPWRDLGAELARGGWKDLTHRKIRLLLQDREVELAGIDDSHINRDRYEEIAGPVPEDADVAIGVMHSPEPRNLEAFAADGYGMLFAGHTHGGQVCLPGYGAVVTNCGLDRQRARGLSRHGPAWLHVSGGLGTSPYAPVRFVCRPEATLVTLTPRIR